MAPTATAPRAEGDAGSGPAPKPRIVMLYEEYIHLPMLKKVLHLPGASGLARQADAHVSILHCRPAQSGSSANACRLLHLLLLMHDVRVSIRWFQTL